MYLRSIVQQHLSVESDIQWRSRGCWGPQDDIALGAPMVNKFQDPDTKTPINVVGYFMIFVFFFLIMGIIYKTNYGFIGEIRAFLEYIHHG